MKERSLIWVLVIVLVLLAFNSVTSILALAQGRKLRLLLEEGAVSGRPTIASYRWEEMVAELKKQGVVLVEFAEATGEPEFIQVSDFKSSGTPPAHWPSGKIVWTEEVRSERPVKLFSTEWSFGSWPEFEQSFNLSREESDYLREMLQSWDSLTECEREQASSKAVEIMQTKTGHLIEPLIKKARELLVSELEAAAARVEDDRP